MLNLAHLSKLVAAIQKAKSEDIEDIEMKDVGKKTDDWVVVTVTTDVDDKVN